MIEKGQKLAHMASNDGLVTVVRRIGSWSLRTLRGLFGRTTDRGLNRAGFHTITPRVGDFEPFHMYSPNVGRFQKRSVRGKLEPEVGKVLSEIINSNSVFWNIGGGWGYWALAVATTGAQVVCFEAVDERAERIREAKEKNDLPNLRVISGIVGETVSLSQFPEPDVILMDVEGWEYEILSSETALLASQPVVIIEIHESSQVMTPGSPEICPTGVKRVLNSKGYRVSLLSERKKQDQYHILGEPSGQA